MAGLPANIVTSHRIGDPTCSQLSARDKEDLNAIATNRGIIIEEEDEVTAVARDYGYDHGDPDILSIEHETI